MRGVRLNVECNRLLRLEFDVFSQVFFKKKVECRIVFSSPRGRDETPRPRPDPKVWG